MLEIIKTAIELKFFYETCSEAMYNPCRTVGLVGKTNLTHKSTISAIFAKNTRNHENPMIYLPKHRKSGFLAPTLFIGNLESSFFMKLVQRLCRTTVEPSFWYEK